MLTLRKEQIEALDKESSDNFLERIYDFLNEEFNDIKNENKKELMIKLEKLKDKGLSYNLITEQQIIIFIITAWLLGENFDTDFPKANAVLLSPDYSPDDKTEWLTKWTESLFKALEE